MSPDPKLAEGDLVLTSSGVGRVVRVGNLNGAPGAWITEGGNDPSAGYLPQFAPDWCVKRAVIGDTVCVHPRFRCFCGLAHVSAEELRWLPKSGEVI